MTSNHQIRQDLHDAIQRALSVEARARDLGEPLALFEDVARDPIQRSAEVRQLFGDRPPLALVHFDTPGIQQYVFKVQRPVDIFGGSRLVADFTSADESIGHSFYRHLRSSSAAVPPSTVVYAGGGGGLLLVAASEAVAVSRTVAEILGQTTHRDLSTVAAFLPVWPEDLSAAPAAIPDGIEDVLGPLRPVSRYAAAMSALSARLGRDRSSGAKLAEPIPPEEQFQRCHACGAKRGEKTRRRGERQERICASCDARWQYGRQGKDAAEEPLTFEDLVSDLPKTSLAVLYADGANVGRAFLGVGSPAQHRALSLLVDEAMANARDQALAACPWLTQGPELRAQTPICGGDDLILVLPAMAVFEAVGPLISSFETSFDFRQNPLLRDAFGDAADELRDEIGRFGLGVGIAIADDHFPIQFLVDYARQLLKSAKRRIRQGARSAVDFMVLRSGTPLSGSIESLRERYFERRSEDETPGLLLTRRPYCSIELQGLLQRTKLLGDVPTSQLHAVRQEIAAGLALSRSLWRYQHARAKDGEGWAAYRAALQCELADIDRLLWQDLPDTAERDGRWMVTDFLDALEIYDFVNASPPKAPGAAA